MAAFLIRAVQIKNGLPAESFTCAGGANCATTTPDFTDVIPTDPNEAAFFPYVQALKYEGITTVTGTYTPGQNVPRDQMAAFISRAFLGDATQAPSGANEYSVLSCPAGQMYNNLTCSCESILLPLQTSVILNPASVVGGAISQGTVALSDPAPGGGALITLSSSNPSVATVPETVNIAAGSTLTTFIANTNQVSSPTSVSITASYNGTAQTALLTVNPTSTTYTITATSGSGGSITPGSTTVNYLGSVSFTITPASGYALTSLIDNGSNVTNSAFWNGTTYTYTISDVTSNQSIQATFGVGTPQQLGRGPALSTCSFIVLMVAGLGIIICWDRKKKVNLTE
jgi:hypothetical protein